MKKLYAENNGKLKKYDQCATSKQWITLSKFYIQKKLYVAQKIGQ